LAPLIEPPVPTPLSYELEAEFRAEPSLDRGGNQILEWSIETPAGRLSSLAGGGTLTWTAGQPVRVALRWARNGPSLPVVGADGMPRLDGPTALFEYRDAWALLSLLRIHSRPSADDGTAFSLLAFDVPLAPNPDAAPGGPAGLDQALVFLRLRLTALTSIPGEPVRRSLLLAPHFPAVAPDIASLSVASPAPSVARPLSLSPAASP
jgi:type VI secretion system protein ImpL